jgi:hypothetical protein
MKGPDICTFVDDRSSDMDSVGNWISDGESGAAGLGDTKVIDNGREGSADINGELSFDKLLRSASIT